MMRKKTVDVSGRDLLRTTEAQQHFGIGKSKLWHWITAGYFPVFRPDGENSRTTFVRKSDVEKYITTGQPVVQ